MNSQTGFTVRAQVQGKNHDVYILPSESTDGIPFYICRIDNNDVTQVRKDEQHWKQIWGELSQEDVNSIGFGIEGAVLNQ